MGTNQKRGWASLRGRCRIIDSTSRAKKVASTSAVSNSPSPKVFRLAGRVLSPTSAAIKHDLLTSSSALRPRLVSLAPSNLAMPAGSAKRIHRNTIPLAGPWRLRINSNKVGVRQKYLRHKPDDSVMLLATTVINQKGILKDEHTVDRLSRICYWKGLPWYQRELIIPQLRRGKRITQFLKRSKSIFVWVNGPNDSAEDALSALQVFNLTEFPSFGRHITSSCWTTSHCPCRTRWMSGSSITGTVSSARSNCVPLIRCKSKRCKCVSPRDKPATDRLRRRRQHDFARTQTLRLLV